MNYETLFVTEPNSDPEKQEERNPSGHPETLRLLSGVFRPPTG